MPASADGSDAPGWLAQAGDGKGGSAPIVTNFHFGTVLYPNEYPEFIAFGFSNGSDQLAVVHGGKDGVKWGSPTTATLTSSVGQSAAPFHLGEGKNFFDVIFGPWGQQGTGLFIIFYAVANSGSDIAKIHEAESTDGIAWSNDRAITQDSTKRLIFGGRATRGPEDLFLNPHPVVVKTESNPKSCAESDVHQSIDGAGHFIYTKIEPSIFNCPLVMVYDLSDASGGGVGFAYATTIASGAATTFATTAGQAQAVTRGAPGSWDEGDLRGAHVLLRGDMFSTTRRYELYYSGVPSNDPACGTGCASLGVAVSNDGVHYTKPPTPVTDHRLIDRFVSVAPTSLVDPLPAVTADPHQKIYFSALNGDGGSNIFLAYTTPEPSQGPDVTIASSIAGVTNNAQFPAVTAYISDQVGDDAVPGNTDISVDGLHFAPLSVNVTLVTAMRRPAYVIKRSGHIMSTPFADGAHTLTVTASDTNGNTGRTSVTFVVDTKPPSTTLTSFPDPNGQQMGFPKSIGTFSGTTVDGSSPATGTPISEVRIEALDPLGNRKIYDSSNNGMFSLNKETPKAWSWSWIAPADPFFLIPGTYRVTALGTDGVHNVEHTSSANTTTVNVL